MNFDFMYKGSHIVINDIIEVDGINISEAYRDMTLNQLTEILENYLNKKEG